MRRRSIATLIALILCVSAQPVYALHSLAKQANSVALANPGLLVIDPSDDQVLIENQPDSLRIPASVLKLLTTTVALFHLGADARFSTTIWSTAKNNEFLIRGSLDPYLTTSRTLAKRFDQRYLPALTDKAIANGSKKVRIYYQSLYPRDVYSLSVALRAKKVKATFIKVDDSRAQELGEREIDSILSAPLSKMVSHTILWSDNLVADRLARTAARSVGYPFTRKGLTKTYKEVLAELSVSSEGLDIRDGSGLSKENRLSARTLVELLKVIRADSRFESIYLGLPISGETGTLQKRFAKSPLAIGHIHAKTGWVNNSVTMAGYAQSGDKEYVFAILADEITPSLKARNSARHAMDRLLETIIKGDH